ncbi:MAG: hypothetical protein R2827_15100, partial [Bdellovibrionales bacterium]
MRVGRCTVFICTKTLTGKYGEEVAEKLEGIIKDQSAYQNKAVVLDLFNTIKLELDFVRKILPNVKKLQADNVDFYCINAPRGVSRFIKESGFDTA